MTPSLGDLLRQWRGVRGKSQFDLALDAGLSQRHLSFIERGRSAPGRDTLTRIAQALDMPLRDRNTLLLAAGYAPLYSQSAWDSAEMQSITNALSRLLRQHEPFPAVVMDPHWNVLTANEAAPRFFNHFIDMAARKKPRNLLHLMFDPNGMRPYIVNWPDVAASLYKRVERESVGRILDEKTQKLLDELSQYPAADAKGPINASHKLLPVIPITFRKDDIELSYFSMVSTVGAPDIIAAQELRIESMFPADGLTETFHLELMNPRKPP